MAPRDTHWETGPAARLERDSGSGLSGPPSFLALAVEWHAGSRGGIVTQPDRPSWWSRHSVEDDRLPGWRTPTVLVRSTDSDWRRPSHGTTERVPDLHGLDDQQDDRDRGPAGRHHRRRLLLAPLAGRLGTFLRTFGVRAGLSGGLTRRSPAPPCNLPCNLPPCGSASTPGARSRTSSS